MTWLTSLAAATDRLDPSISALLDHFRDEHVPLYLSVAIVATAVALLVLLVALSAVAWTRLARLRRVVRTAGRGAEFRSNFAGVDRQLAGSIVGPAWAEYRQALRQTASTVLYLRRPDEYLGATGFPARFFGAAHGYFIGVGLLLTFVGLVAALKFAAVGVASHDLGVAKEALNGLLAAAAFKFMTSIAGLGSSLLLSIAARSATAFVEGAMLGLGADLEHAMTPVVTEALAYDQLAATRAQLELLQQLAAMPAPEPMPAPAPVQSGMSGEALQEMLSGFITEMRKSSGDEMKQATARLAHVGDAIGQMQGHIGQAGDRFAEQLGLAATRLLSAANKLEQRLDGKVEQASVRLGAMAASYDASLQAQSSSMKDIVAALDRAREAIDASSASWLRAATPVMQSVEASRQVASDLGQVAERVGSAQRDMTAMAQAVAQLSEKVGAVWDSYRNRFEKIDGELQAVFERLQGGTRAFSEEFIELVGKLDSSLANGMEAFSLGTEELREVAEMLVTGVNAKAA